MEDLEGIALLGIPGLSGLESAGCSQQGQSREPQLGPVPSLLEALGMPGRSFPQHVKALY